MGFSNEAVVNYYRIFRASIEENLMEEDKTIGARVVKSKLINLAKSSNIEAIKGWRLGTGWH